MAVLKSFCCELSAHMYTASLHKLAAGRKLAATHLNVSNRQICVVAQVLKVAVTINLIIIDHSRMIQAFRIIEISKYDDGGQLTTHGQLMQGSSTLLLKAAIPFI